VTLRRHMFFRVPSRSHQQPPLTVLGETVSLTQSGLEPSLSLPSDARTRAENFPVERYQLNRLRIVLCGVKVNDKTRGAPLAPRVAQHCTAWLLSPHVTLLSRINWGLWMRARIMCERGNE